MAPAVSQFRARRVQRIARTLAPFSLQGEIVVAVEEGAKTESAWQAPATSPRRE